MADPRSGFGRAGMTVAAVLATVGGWLALTVRDGDDRSPSPVGAAEAPAALELEAIDPTPVTTTRSSR